MANYFVLYQRQADKLNELLEDNGLTGNFDPSSYPIRLTVTPDTAQGAQMELFREMDDTTSGDAKLIIEFPVGDINLAIYGRLFLSDSLMGKIRSSAKAMVNLWLQAYYAQMRIDPPKAHTTGYIAPADGTMLFEYDKPDVVFRQITGDE